MGQQEVRLAAGSSTPVCTRYYTFAGQTIAARQNTTLTWLTGDHHGTSQIAINSQTLEVTHRRHLPFGAPRGTTPTSWPSEQGFLGGTHDPTTDLTHLGAREYDPTLGRFLTADPIIDITNPQQLQAYTYSNNNPTTYSDPTGLTPIDQYECGNDPGGCGGSDSGGSGGAPPAPPTPAPPAPSKGPAPVTITGIGQNGIAGARGAVTDITALAHRSGYQTNVVVIDTETQVQDGYNVGKYTTIPGIVLALSFTLLPTCVDPISDHPIATNLRHTRAESDELSAALAAVIDRQEHPTYRTTMGPGEFFNLALAAASVLPLPIGRLGAILRGGRGLFVDAAALPGYRSFSQAKSALGSPGVNNVFDHVVEQSQIARSGFRPDEIHHPFNMNPVDARMNQIKANYYSSKQPFTGGMTVRDWMTGQGFVDQYTFGMDTLAKIQAGVIR